MKSAATTETVSAESTAEAATEPAAIITITVAPKASEKPAAVVGISIAIVVWVVWVIIRIVCVGITVIGTDAKMLPSVSPWDANKHHDPR
jgi:uncharacterized membrane protein